MRLIQTGVIVLLSTKRYLYILKQMIDWIENKHFNEIVPFIMLAPFSNILKRS